jgi:hypothetical protein
MLPHGKHVVFFMVQELGHLSPAFDVGRRLITQGYNVSFWCTSKGRAIVLKAGFDAVDMLDDDLDERALIRSSCFNGRMEKELKLKSVTKIIADCQLRMLGLLAWKLDLDFMICSTSLPVPTYDPDQGYPSVRSSHGPFETDQERRDFNTFMVETFPSEFDLELLQYAKDCGFPAYYLRVQPWGIPWMTCVPEVILCPESFEFPHTRSSKRIFIAPRMLEHETKGFGRIDFLVSFGSRPETYPQAKTVISFILAAFEKHPEWTGTIALGSLYEDFCERQPANVTLAKWVPQAEILSSVDVFVTHGGLSSIKEAVAMKVPMLVLPFAWDQAGNAKRVEFHKIGIYLEKEKWGEKTIEKNLGHTLARMSDFKPHLDMISKCFKEEGDCVIDFDNLWSRRTKQHQDNDMREKILKLEKQFFP